MKKCVECGDVFDPPPTQHAKMTCSSDCAIIREQHRQRLKNYGLTLDTYDALWERLGGRCAICGKAEVRGQRRMAVDHDHTCCAGKKSCGRCVRGLLCSLCNTGLGSFGDDPRMLERAAQYLEDTGYKRLGAEILHAEWGSAVFSPPR